MEVTREQAVATVNLLAMSKVITSFGPTGHAALRFALTHPERARQLVELIEANGGGEEYGQPISPETLNSMYEWFDHFLKKWDAMLADPMNGAEKRQEAFNRAVALAKLLTADSPDKVIEAIKAAEDAGVEVEVHDHDDLKPPASDYLN